MHLMALRFLHTVSEELSAMSASTQTRCTQDLPGNCTLENALKTIVDEYHRYSSQEGKMDLLSFKDFKKLMNEQAKEFLQVCVSATGAVLCSLEGWSPLGLWGG